MTPPELGEKAFHRYPDQETVSKSLPGKMTRPSSDNKRMPAWPSYP